MTEEEKKAFEWLDHIIDVSYPEQSMEQVLNNKNVIFYYIEKLQKENIKLKQEQAKRSWIHVKENGEVEPLLYISKDKIRKKIEELENREQCYYEFSTADLVDLLKILLEEE